MITALRFFTGCRSRRTAPALLCLFLTVLAPLSAHAQSGSWSTGPGNWVPCDANGTVIPSPDQSGVLDLYDQSTGLWRLSSKPSGSAAISSGYNDLWLWMTTPDQNGNLPGPQLSGGFEPFNMLLNPNDFRDWSGYLFGRDPYPQIGLGLYSEADNNIVNGYGVYGAFGNPAVSIGGSVSAHATSTLTAFWLWNPCWSGTDAQGRECALYPNNKAANSPADETYNPPGMPSPPDTVQFLLNTQVQAYSDIAFSNISPYGTNVDDKTGRSASSVASDEVFNEISTATIDDDTTPLVPGDTRIYGPFVQGHHLVRARVSHNIAEVYLVAHVDTAATNSVPFTPYEGGNSSGSPSAAVGSGSVTAEAAPITLALSTPSPMIHPEVGNDPNREENQFVYGAIQLFESPLDFTDQGALESEHWLEIPAKVICDGATPEVMEYLKDHIEVTLTPEIPNLKPHTLKVSGNTLIVQTDYDDSIQLGDLKHTYDGFLCNGLPESNDDFGNHQVIVKLDGQVVDIAHIQTFFHAPDQSHPADALAPNTWGTPNWYYYYNQIYPSPGTYLAYNVTHTMFIRPFPIIISDTTDGWQDQPVFDFDPEGADHFARCVGSFSALGILAYIQSCVHEQGHQTVFQFGNIMVVPETLASLASTDGDSVDDAWETYHHMKPNNPNTTGYYTNEEPGDNEFLPDIQAISKVIGLKTLWTRDWSDNGIQWSRNDLINGPLPDNPSDYSFAFEAVVSGGAYTQNREYHVKTLQDLIDQYPSLIHGLEDLNKP